MPEFDSKRAKLREIKPRNDVEDNAAETGRVETEPPRRPTTLKAVVVPLGRSDSRNSAGSNERLPRPDGPDDDDPGPAAA